MMLFEWDDSKYRLNIEKHGISFEMASQIFSGYVLSQRLASKHYGEERILSIGRCDEAYVALITVIHTERKEKTRIISARPASRSERNVYEKALQDTTNSKANRSD